MSVDMDLPLNTARRDRPPKREAKRRPKILLVEDDDDDALFLQMTLQRAGAEALEVHRVRALTEARTQMDREPYDVVVTDLGLPDASGNGVVSTLVRHRSNTPVVVLSGLEDDRVAAQARALGAYDFLVKGMAEPQALLALLESTIAVGQRPDEGRRSSQTGMP